MGKEEAEFHVPLLTVQFMSHCSSSFALMQSPSPELGQDWDSRSHGSLELL